MGALPLHALSLVHLLLGNGCMTRQGKLAWLPNLDHSAKGKKSCVPLLLR